MTKEQAIGIFNANYKQEWRESTSESRRQAVTNFWNQYVDQMYHVDRSIDEKTAKEWYDSYYS